MTGFRNESEKHHFVEKLMMPILTHYCTQHPIKIDYKKLSKAPSSFSFNLLQLAWLHSISEMNIVDISSINWDDHSLCARVMEIQEYLYKISDDEYGRSEVIINGEQKKFEVRYFSLKLAIKLLNFISFINPQDAPKEIEKELKRAWQNLYSPRLANINLVHELSIGLRDYCKNKPVMLVPTRLPRAFWLKHLAYYLAISSKNYSDYGDVNYEDNLIVNNAIGIHKMLREELNNILNIHLKSFSLMSTIQCDTAMANGVLQIAIVATRPIREISDDLSVEVTKELALRILKQLPEFSYLFESLKSDDEEKISTSPTNDINEKENVKNKLSAITKPSNVGHDTTRHLKGAVELILTENPNHVLMPQAIWNTLFTCTTPSHYNIKTTSGSGARRKIEFQCGHITNYHAAQVHINKAIAWHTSKKP